MELKTIIEQLTEKMNECEEFISFSMDIHDEGGVAYWEGKFFGYQDSINALKDLQ